MNFSNTSCIPYIDFGGSGLTIHFAHANGYPPLCYLPLINLLCKNFNVISMLQRPLWPESDPNEIKDWRPLTTDLLNFLDQQSLKLPIAIGHSLGGITSLRAVIREPDRFRALVLIDPVLFSPKYIIARKLIWSMDIVYRYHPLIKATKYRRRKFSDLDSIFTSFRSKSVFKYMDDESLWAYVKGITVPDPEDGYMLSFSPEWEMSIYATGIWNDLDIWRDISKINIPILIVRGEESDTFLTSSANLLIKKLPSANYVSFENATHLVPLEYPYKMSQVIVNFLQEKL